MFVPHAKEGALTLASRRVRSEYAANIRFVEPLRSGSSPTKHGYNANGAALFTLALQPNRSLAHRTHKYEC
jgi:hypothetical protein